ncbi:protein of unknown function DUF2949 [Cyanobacterium sp. HL-69]|uniref:DUF2949 domain-containing protein n=1 Tax=unclassified Cyanobacterium TaxID=2629879 RepID=UPI000852636C|nr:DUF2949 domain-containing protein [Cyanobacterium sp. IPPAS B-1200]AUC61132.1 protein of unknown function DUF2949 [Cyanobacterium sp. HL-69]OEJ79317.1 hypothetical protein A5482_00185 [Cyanobacterium sp. IPPAS B-1200]
MPPIIYSNFIEFLSEEINLSPESIAVAQRSVEQNTEFMPMVLWQYGLVTIEQLDRICDWLEKF